MTRPEEEGGDQPTGLYAPATSAGSPTADRPDPASLLRQYTSEDGSNPSDHPLGVAWRGRALLLYAMTAYGGQYVLLSRRSAHVQEKRQLVNSRRSHPRDRGPSQTSHGKPARRSRACLGHAEHPPFGVTRTDRPGNQVAEHIGSRTMTAASGRYAVRLLFQDASVLIAGSERPGVCGFVGGAA
jgi:hypothetical protein